MKKATPITDPELAPVQQHVLRRARENGLTLDTALARLGAIIEEGEPETALVGIRTFMDYTVGRPPTTGKTLNVHVSGKTDRFFDRDTFEKPPAPRIED